jgi:hypothetical protein
VHTLTPQAVTGTNGTLRTLGSLLFLGILFPEVRFPTGRAWCREPLALCRLTARGRASPFSVMPLKAVRPTVPRGPSEATALERRRTFGASARYPYGCDEAG